VNRRTLIIGDDVPRATVFTESSAIMESAAAQLAGMRNGALVARAWEVITLLARSVQQRSLEQSPTLSIVESDDGSIWIEWILPSRRIGFAVETDARASSWHYASALSDGNEANFGPLSKINMAELVDWLLCPYEGTKQ
jgi:hypothetical protein